MRTNFYIADVAKDYEDFKLRNKAKQRKEILNLCEGLSVVERDAGSIVEIPFKDFNKIVLFLLNDKWSGR